MRGQKSERGTVRERDRAREGQSVRKVKFERETE